MIQFISFGIIPASGSSSGGGGGGGGGGSDDGFQGNTVAYVDEAFVGTSSLGLRDSPYTNFNEALYALITANGASSTIEIRLLSNITESASIASFNGVLSIKSYVGYSGGMPSGPLTIDSLSILSDFLLLELNSILISLLTTSYECEYYAPAGASFESVITSLQGSGADGVDGTDGSAADNDDRSDLDDGSDAYAIGSNGSNGANGTNGVNGKISGHLHVNSLVANGGDGGVGGRGGAGALAIGADGPPGSDGDAALYNPATQAPQLIVTFTAIPAEGATLTLIIDNTSYDFVFASTDPVLGGYTWIDSTDFSTPGFSSTALADMINEAVVTPGTITAYTTGDNNEILHIDNSISGLTASLSIDLTNFLGNDSAPAAYSSGGGSGTDMEGPLPTDGTAGTPGGNATASGCDGADGGNAGNGGTWHVQTTATVDYHSLNAGTPGASGAGGAHGSAIAGLGGIGGAGANGGANGENASDGSTVANDGETGATGGSASNGSIIVF